MSDIDIQVKATSDLKGIEDATKAVGDLGNAGTAAGGSESSSGMSWAATATAMFVGSMASNIFTSLPEIAGNLFKTGEAATKVAGGFAAAGGADVHLAGLRTVTDGLVSDTNLMATATLLMRANLSTSVGSAQDIIKKGAEIGTAYSGDATTGVKDLGKAIIDVGNYTQIKDLGGDADDVKKKFEDLKTKMSDKDAWGLAVMTEVDSMIKEIPKDLDATHPAIDRFGAKFNNFRDTAGKAFTDWLDQQLGRFENFDKFMQGVNNTGIGSTQNVQAVIDAQNPPNTTPVTRDVNDGPMGPFRPAPDHSSQYGDVTGEGEGYGMYEPPVQSGRTTSTANLPTIDKPKVTRAEFDAIVVGANAATAATATFGTVSTLAMGGLAISSAVAAGQIGNLTTQGESAVSIMRQLQVELKTLASLSIVVNATRQASGGSGGSDGPTPARGPR